ncbi:hypothetical protein [Lachnoclostridium phytofermentans]|uniref:Uncharacterized protein n=1 Tax=Lachnoclostridium phytofermentans (strain ATCC 700394 / DSM 18823 / ISDg) TaxID=357809 RepID=A9KQ18_LACP7|nr:hypothetical protein [Lachnoclostridium phytofermentans]ABX43330.1 hypothetical protein Cphy_2973 [Lachnoclostridium phytofermentans ISDg]
MDISEIFKANIELKNDIEKFLKRGICDILGYDARIISNDHVNYVLEYYDRYNITVDFNRAEFYTFILAKVNESNKVNAKEVINIEEDFKLFISKKISNGLLKQIVKSQ